MAEQVTGDRYSVLDGKFLEIKRQLRQGDGYPFSLDKLERGLQALIEGQFQQSSDDKRALDALFTSPQEQLANVRRWNEERSWGFSEEDFTGVEAQIAELTPEQGLQRWTLTAFSDDMPQDADGYIQIAAEQQEGRIYRSDYLPQPLDKNRIRLLEGIEYPGKCLMWVLADLGSDCGRKPRDVRKAKNALHIQGLAAAAQHPKWVRAMYTEVGGTFIPALFLPGLQVNWNKTDKREDDDWSGVFIIGFDRYLRKIFVNVHKDNGGGRDWAVGRVVRELRG